MAISPRSNVSGSGGRSDGTHSSSVFVFGGDGGRGGSIKQGAVDVDGTCRDCSAASFSASSMSFINEQSSDKTVQLASCSAGCVGTVSAGAAGRDDVEGDSSMDWSAARFSASKMSLTNEDSSVIVTLLAN